MNDQTQTPSTTPAGAASRAEGANLTAGLGTFTDAELSDLSVAIHTEQGRREEERYRATDTCPECDGSRYTGSEMDHDPCCRCKATGKYVPNE
jgi:DnaJ-class molecular chaperone